MTLLDGGNPDAAAVLLERVAGDQPGSYAAREGLARARFDSGRYAEAAAAFRELAEDFPAEDYARYGLGLSLFRLGDVRAAAEHLSLAAAMRPGSAHYAQSLREVRATLRARGDSP